MKFKEIFSCILLLSLSPIYSKRTAAIAPVSRQPQAAAPQPIPVPQPQQIPQAAIKQQAPVKQQSPEKPTSYAQALTMIKTNMSPDEIILTDKFTQKFVDFIISLHLSGTETQALLEAGAHLYMPWSNDETKNKKIIMYIKNTLSDIIRPEVLLAQNIPIQVQKPVIPGLPKPAQKFPVGQKKPQNPQFPLPIQKSPAPAQQPAQVATTPEVIGKIGTTNITAIQGDITQQKIDAIVNAANENLQHGSGVAGAISTAAGPGLQKFCDEMPIIAHGQRCPTGMAVITPPFNLKSNIHAIIHTAGPLGNNPQREILLRDSYQNSLKLAMQYGLRSIAFPAISTALFGYNIDEATPIAFAAVTNFLEQNPNSFDEVRFVLFSPHDLAIYKKWKSILQA